MAGRSTNQYAQFATSQSDPSQTFIGVERMYIGDKEINFRVIATISGCRSSVDINRLDDLQPGTFKPQTQATYPAKEIDAERFRSWSNRNRPNCVCLEAEPPDGTPRTIRFS